MPDEQTATMTESVGLEEAGEAESRDFSSADIRHNMTVCVMLEAIFTTGYTDFLVALQPLLVLLKASNALIGLATGAQFAALPGLFLSPFISRLFARKKWYLFTTHLPYLGALGLMGLAVLLYRQLGLSQPALLMVVFALTMAHQFFAGFVALPYQEYAAACIPMSHRGRFLGYSFSAGGVTSMLSAALGGLILLRLSKPLAFGYLFLMTWFICQSGYVVALLAREKPVPREKAPKPWSGAMLRAVKTDSRFLRTLLATVLHLLLLVPVWGFINIYGFRELKMPPATSATIQLITQAVRIGSCTFVGVLTDRLGPRRIFPYWSLVAFAALLPVLFTHNPFGVYASTALSALYMAGSAAAYTPLLYGLPKPEHRAGHFTVQLIFFNASYSIGPIVVGCLCDHFHYKSVFAAYSVLCLALFPISILLLRGLGDSAKDYT